MKNPSKKGIASVILAIFGFVVVADDSIGRMQKLEALMPAPVRPYLPMIYGGLFLAALLLTRSQHADEVEALKQPGLDALHASNAALRSEIEKLTARVVDRRLSDEQVRTIARVVERGIHQIRESFRAAGVSEVELAKPISVQLYSGENDREITVYRADFERAFQRGGFEVALGEFVGTAGFRENDQFVGTISVLRGKSTNVVTPFVLDALREAGIGFTECDSVPLHTSSRSHRPSYVSPVVVLIIGLRE